MNLDIANVGATDVTVVTRTGEAGIASASEVDVRIIDPVAAGRGRPVGDPTEPEVRDSTGTGTSVRPNNGRQQRNRRLRPAVAHLDVTRAPAVVVVLGTSSPHQTVDATRCAGANGLAVIGA
jgi:hypothetical protein